MPGHIPEGVEQSQALEEEKGPNKAIENVLKHSVMATPFSMSTSYCSPEENPPAQYTTLGFSNQHLLPQSLDTISVNSQIGGLIQGI